MAKNETQRYQYKNYIANTGRRQTIIGSDTPRRPRDSQDV